MTFTIRPAASGGWLAFVAGPLLLVVPDGAVDAPAAWSAVRSPSGFQAVLDLLTSGGLAATPSFVLVEWEPGAAARALVRGDLALTASDASGEQSLSGSGVSTWVERSLPGVTALSLAVPGAVPASESLLPLDSGVALVSAVASEPAPAAAVVSEPAPAAPVASEPAPAAPVARAAQTAPPASPASAVPAAPTAPAAAAPARVRLEPAIEVDIGETVREPPEHPAAELPPAATAGSAESAPEGYDYLFGDTVYRGVADAAVREAAVEGDAEGGAGEPGASGDVDDTLHDGETVMVDSIKKLRGRRRPAGGAAPVAPAAPRLVLVMPGGAREPLTQPILIGRSPTVGKVSGPIPRPLTLGPGDQDISRNHAQFALEGGTVVVTDLHSRNGTSIVLPGKSPQKLRAGEPTSVIVGTVVDFGGGLTITVEEES